MRKLISMLLALVMVLSMLAACTAEPVGPIDPDPGIVPETLDLVIDTGKDLFAKAEAAAETEEQKYRVRKSALQVEYLEIHYEGVRLNESTYNGINKAITNYIYFGEGEDGNIINFDVMDFLQYPHQWQS